MRLPRYRPPASVPDVKAPGFSRWLLDQLRSIGDDLAGAASTDVDSTIQQERLDLPAGATRRVSPTTSGTVVALEAPSADNASDQAILIIENPRGTVTVTANPHTGADGKVTPSLINGERQASFSRSGVVVFYSNGVDQWKTHAETPAETSSAEASALTEALDAEVVLGAASASYPSGRIATDSTEIDADMAVSGVISWALRTGSVALSKLVNLAGLSVLGRSANSSGVMAAITASGARKFLRSNTAGDAIAFLALAASSTDNGYASKNTYYSGNALSWTTAADVPDGSEFLFILDAGGGSGGSGAADVTTNNAACGGACGGGGARKVFWCSRAQIIAGLPVTGSFPAAATGGAAVSTTGAKVDGNPGADGGDASISFNGVIVAQACGGGAGAAGTGTIGVAGAGGGGWQSKGTSAGAGGAPGGGAVGTPGGDSAFGGGGGSSALGNRGGNSAYGGSGGGRSAAATAGVHADPSGKSSHGGTAGGCGGGAIANTAGTLRATDGADGGGHEGFAGGAKGAGATGTGPGANGSPGAAANEIVAGTGGGGGGGHGKAGAGAQGGDGAAGGDGGGGGGGGGAGSCDSGTATSGRGGDGGRPQCIVVGFPG